LQCAEDRLKAPPRPECRAGSRGWGGRGGGMAQLLPSVREYRGTTVQVCGLWPFSSGASSPMIGVPLGRHEETQATVCCDPISWFQRARLISNPSAFILGKPGLGKSTVVRRMFIGLSAQGVHPLILGDLKGEHVKAVKALGGQVITLGRGVGYLNILDPGQAVEAAQLLEDNGHHEDAARVRADAHGRRLTMVVSLITISRNNPPTDQEQTILDRALRVLDDTLRRCPGPEGPAGRDRLRPGRAAPGRAGPRRHEHLPAGNPGVGSHPAGPDRGREARRNLLPANHQPHETGPGRGLRRFQH
jgi:hypothetical protein